MSDKATRRADSNENEQENEVPLNQEDVEKEIAKLLIEHNDLYEAKQLERVSIRWGIERYSADRERELANSTLEAIEKRCGRLEEWCEENGIEAFSDLDKRDLIDYFDWLVNEAPTEVTEYAKATEKAHRDTIRCLLRHLSNYGYVKPNLHESIKPIQLNQEEAARDATVDPEVAKAAKAHLERYKFGSTPHVVISALVNTGCRTSTLRAIDRDDCKLDAEIPHIEIRHRPESGTPLKNGKSGERNISLSEEFCELIVDYLSRQPVSEDEFGREPLFTAGFGRLSASTIRKYTYTYTRPCAIGRDCPEGRDPEDCEAEKPSSASKCPYSKSPHAFRRGYITENLKSIEPGIISEVCDVSLDVLYKHYDARDEFDKMAARLKLLEKSGDSLHGYGGE
ncbi:tyrosine-type recombinase/integrase [Natronorarus salvus]|uniref:tyrosine-type recombinase/integrase n=1 Tax=Natronorarus salvus TaxID=3117733 RepID=UPI002F2679FE